MPTASILDVQLRAGGATADAAAKQIRAAIAKADGVFPVAAEALGVSTRTLFRMAKKIGLNKEAAKLRVKAGFSSGSTRRWITPEERAAAEAAEAKPKKRAVKAKRK